jgi:putative transposase
MNVKKIRRLMKKYNLYCPIWQANPYRRMAKALKKNNVADNLLKKEFKKYRARKFLLIDITYNRVKMSPFNNIRSLYKKILAYVFSETMEVDFVLETVN